jgi:hypothetical protein
VEALKGAEDRLQNLVVNTRVVGPAGVSPISNAICIMERARQALAHHTPVCRDSEEGGWRPIETAPRGTAVLLWFPKRYQGNGGVSWGCFIGGDWLDSRAIRDNDASHWMPMPAAPLKDPDHV